MPCADLNTEYGLPPNLNQFHDHPPGGIFQTITTCDLQNYSSPRIVSDGFAPSPDGLPPASTHPAAAEMGSGCNE